MTLFSLFRILFLSAIVFNLQISFASEEKLEFDHVEQNEIFYKSSEKNQKLHSFKTTLHDIKFLDTLYSKTGGLPYFLLSANPCVNCAEERTLYMIRPHTDTKPSSFVYPGKILDLKTRELLLESRSFYGECLPGRKDIFIVFQKEKVDRRHRMQSSVILAEPQKEYLSEKLLEKHLPNISSTLKLVKSKRCQEIESRKRFTSNKSFNIQFPLHDDKDDDNDDDLNDDNEKTKRTLAGDSGAIEVESP